MTPTLVLLSIVFYFAILFLISYLTGRKADNAGFFVGNRKSPWFIVAFAMIGAAISGVTFVSVPGTVASSNFSYLQMVLGFVFGQLIIAFVLVPLFYKMNLTSIYEYLENRFGTKSYKTGAWIFFVGKMTGAAIRLFVVCVVLQLLVFDPILKPLVGANISFLINTIFTVGLVWLYTYKGGVKSLIWTDSLKTFCLVFSVILCIYYISKDLNFNFSTMTTAVSHHKYSKMFFFDDVNSKKYFFKQFFAGIFMMIALTGLDQDLMQKNLSCKNFKDAQKNMIVSGVLQFFVVALFLILGVLLYIFVQAKGLTAPSKTDDLFPMIATNNYFPPIVGILFIIGLISAAYSAAGSALTALTTSYTIDILEAQKKQDEEQLSKTRKRVHLGMAIVMGIVIIITKILNQTSVLDAVYLLASYTYGPILGIFAFGLIPFKKSKKIDFLLPFIAVGSPIICYVLASNSEAWFNGYKFSYELLILNGFITFFGLFVAQLIVGESKK